MNRNQLIRIAVGFVAGVAIGYTFAAACTWICTAASLGAFLSFLVWLIGMLMMLGTCFVAGVAVDNVLTDRRLDAACNTTRGWLTSMRAKLTT